jgi:hypothetical protein
MGAAHDFDSGRTRRDGALNVLETRRATYIVKARRAFLQRLLECGQCTIDDIRADVPLPDSVSPMLFGCTPTPFARNGVVERIGFKSALRSKAHARPVSLWRLLDRSRALVWLADNPAPVDVVTGETMELFPPGIERPSTGIDGYFRGM